MRKMPPPMAPPPRMKDLFIPPEPVATPSNRFDFNRGDRSESIVRNVPPEDPYDDRSYLSQTMRSNYTPQYMPPPSASRQISQTSSTGTGATMQSGSENWETFSEQSDDPPERDVDLYYHRQQMARSKRFTPEGGHAASPRGVNGKKLRGIRPVDGAYMVEEGGTMVRTVEGSECGWTDDGDAF
jgi:protein regulator of cytokinesis 1